MNLLKKLKMSLKIFDGNPNTQKTDSPGLSDEMKPIIHSILLKWRSQI